MLDEELTFTVTRRVADRFCTWLIAMGGWAASSPVESPVLHRLIRTAVPDSRSGIPRADVVVMADETALAKISRRFRPIFDAFQTYESAAGVRE